MVYGYIYKITNQINGKVYIGQHKCKKGIITETDMISDGYMGSGKILTQAKKKYGVENFTKEIVVICEDKEELNETEKFCILLVKLGYGKDCYNESSGGEGGDTIRYKTKTEKTEINKKKSRSIKESLSSRSDEEKGEQVRKRLNTQNTRTEEEKEISKRKNSESNKISYRNLTKEEKQNRENKRRDKYVNRYADTYSHDFEYKDNRDNGRKKMSKSHQKYPPVAMVDTVSGNIIKVFDTASNAGRCLISIGVTNNKTCGSMITQACRESRSEKYKNRKIRYGYYWEFITEEEYERLNRELQ